MTEQTAKSAPELQDENNPQQQVDSEISEYSEENKGLDAFIQDATKTKAQESGGANKDGEKDNTEVKPYSYSEAASYVGHGLDLITQEASELLGNQLVMPPKVKRIAEFLLAPLGMKYGHKFEQYIKSKQDGNVEGYMPEIMATLGIAGVGGFLYWQNGQIEAYKALQLERQAAEEKAKNDGD